MAAIVIVVTTVCLLGVIAWLVRLRYQLHRFMDDFERDRKDLWSSVIDPPSVFVSYRRADSRTIAHRFAAQLRQEHGLQVFIDESEIKGGEDFWQRIQTSVRHADAVYFVIDKEWETAKRPEASEPALLDPGDWVRKEIKLTLDNGIRAVPVLVDNRRVPSPDQLPSDILPLFRNAGLPLDCGRDFEVHTATLAKVASSSEGEVAKRRRVIAAKRDNASMSRLFDCVSHSLGAAAVLAGLVVVASGAFCAAVLQHDQSERQHERQTDQLEAGSRDLTRQVTQLGTDNQTVRKVVSEANSASMQARDIANKIKEDVDCQKSGMPYSLSEMAHAETSHGGKDAVFANWKTPRRMVVEGYAYEWKADSSRLTLVPSKADDDGAALALYLSLAPDAPSSMRAVCSSCAKAKSKVRVLALTRSRTINRVAGDLELILALD